jgi:hypothetical protein
MNDQNVRFGPPPDDDAVPGEALPPDLDALGRRLLADGAAWQRALPDPVRVAERIRAIPLAAARDSDASDERASRMSTPVSLPPDPSHNTPRPDQRSPRPRRLRGLVAALAAALIVVLLAIVLAQLAGRHGTTPANQPTQSPALPTPTQPVATTPPTATSTPVPTGTWTTVQAFTGSGNYTSAPIQITSPWRLIWQCNLSMGNAGPYPLVVTVTPSSGSGGGQQAINTTCKTGNTQGTGAQYTSPTGSVRLNITSAADGEWDVRVQVLR